MKYKVGDSVFFVESQREVRAGVVIGIAGGRYTVKLGYESAIRLPEDRLYPTEQDAFAAIPEKYKTPPKPKRDWHWWDS